jgi:hypothetical protein
MNNELKIALSKFKADIKLVSEFTRQYKQAFKEWQRTDKTTAIEAVLAKYKAISSTLNINVAYTQYAMYFVKSYARHMHVAYSLLKGNKLSEIEKTEKALNVDKLKGMISLYIDSAEIMNSIDFNEKSGFIAGILNKIKEVCHG